MFCFDCDTKGKTCGFSQGYPTLQFHNNKFVPMISKILFKEK